MKNSEASTEGEYIMWSKTRKAMYERLAPSLKGRAFYDFEYCRPHYRTEPPANPRCHCVFCSYNRFFRIVIDKKEKIIIANSDVYYKSESYPTEEEKRSPLKVHLSVLRNLFLSLCCFLFLHPS